MTIRDDSTGHDAPLSSEGGGGGAVDSVNGQTGPVVLDAGDVGAVPEGEALTRAFAGTTETLALGGGLGDVEVIVLPAGKPFLAVMLEGDTAPRWLFTGDPGDGGIYFGDGTSNILAGAYIGAGPGGAGLLVYAPSFRLDAADLDLRYGGLIQYSPDGTAWRQTVADDGTSTWTEV